MKNIFRITLVCVVAFFVSCSNANVERIPIEMPTCLQGNAEVERFVDNYAETASQFIALSMELSADASMMKMAKITVKMSGIASDIEELEAQRPLIEADFTPEQKEALEAIVYMLQVRMGQLNGSPSGIDESEMAAVQNLKNEKTAQQIEIDEEMALRDEAIAQMKADGTWEDEESKSNELNMPKFMHFLFPIFIVGAIIFSIVMSIKRFGGKVKEIGYAVGDFQEKAQDLLDDPKKVTGQDRELSKDEREGLEKVMELMNKRK